MELDLDKIDQAVLGLLYLTLHDGNRAWKGLDWGSLDRLHERGLIENPTNKSKSVVLTADGMNEAERMVRNHFTQHTASRWAALSKHPEIEHCPADGARGVLCRSAVDAKHFFRVYDDNGEFTDYSLAHDDLYVTIEEGAMSSFYRRGGEHWLDHSPQVLGIDERE